MAVEKNKDSCNSCLFFIVSDRGMGLCKRYPDVINKHNTDWCGEFVFEGDPIQEMVVEITKESIQEQVATLKPKAGRPRKVA